MLLSLVPVCVCDVLCVSEIGAGLTGFGSLFLLLGVLLLFDKALLALGNVRRRKHKIQGGSTIGIRASHSFQISFSLSLLPSQLLFLLGITLLIGAKKTIVFFSRRSKWRGTACFLGGITLVLIGWPVWGMIIEIFGIFNLFGLGNTHDTPPHIPHTHESSQQHAITCTMAQTTFSSLVLIRSHHPISFLLFLV